MPTSKNCSKCNLEKPIGSFYFRKKGDRAGQFYDRCKECYRDRGRNYYHENKIRQLPLALERRRKKLIVLRNIVNEHKRGKPCADCGATFPAYVMDFDHLNPESKINSIGKIGSKGLYTAKAVIEEIKKCELVCANCHRIRTFRRLALVIKD